MKKCFAQLFWGLLIIFVDFELNGFDLVADIAGYLTIAMGCASLAPLSEEFAIAKRLGFLLALLWLIGLLVPRGSSGAMAFGQVVAIMDALLVWFLLGGIQEFAQSKGRDDVGDRAHHRRVSLAVLVAIGSVFTWISEGTGIMGPLLLILAVAVIVVMIQILVLVHRVKVELAT